MMAIEYEAFVRAGVPLLIGIALGWRMGVMQERERRRRLKRERRTLQRLGGSYE